jgi:fatty-acyl-CoA synthase
MDSERVTIMVVVTPMLYELLDHLDCVPGRFPALTAINYRGAASSPARLRQVIECFGPVLSQGYGGTEMGLISHLSP